MTASDWLLEQEFQNKFFVAKKNSSIGKVTRKNSKSMKSREEIRFLALLNKSQEKAALLRNKESDKISAIIEDEWRVPKVIKKSDIFVPLSIFDRDCFADAVLQVTPVGLGKCRLTGQIFGWSNRLSALLAC